MIVVTDLVNVKEKKLEQMKLARKDPLFLADIEEIQSDIDLIDHESI